MLLQETIDTANYMIAGYSIFFVVIISYTMSLATRWKKLQEDLVILEDLEN
ncbi:MAG: hypothetical protein HN392_14190 [Anaerolineae bacterium]|jgi:hypothetical protein|nr:hypothetical protein [Anaerolineae bacterium]MBT7074344.1 hypothetical protein [Anaerolineae bacterium]MBT7781498.1 hypothetical protein [Anaerolineae bacterium]